MPVPANAESVPPVATTSARAKVVEAFESVKVIFAVVPLLRVASDVASLMVGARVSIDRAGEAPARLVFPAASVNFPAATAMLPAPVKLAVGVKIAVYAFPAPVKAESVPPVTATSAAVKSATSSESVNVTVAVSPVRMSVREGEIETVGASVSIAIGVARDVAATGLPAMSVKAPSARLTVPSPSKPAVGVKSAV